jgi:hypothetical protein
MQDVIIQRYGESAFLIASRASREDLRDFEREAGGAPITSPLLTVTVETRRCQNWPPRIMSTVRSLEVR